nr:CYP362A7 protein [Diaphanosoma celebensis]
MQASRLRTLSIDPFLRSISTTTVKQQTSVNKTEWASAKPFDQMPGQKRWPILGTAWQVLPVIGVGISWTDQVKMQGYLEKTYGPIGREIFPGFPPMVWSTNPDDAEVMYRNEGRFPIRLGFDTLKKYREKRVEHYSSAGLILAQGEDWWKLRSKAQQPMMKPKNIYNYLPAINDIGDEFIDRIRLIRQENNEMKPDFINELYRWALESVAVVALNTRLGCLSPSLAPDSEAQRMISAVNTSFTEIARLELSFPFWRFMMTPALKRLFKAQDIFTETSIKHINKIMEKIKNRPEDSEEEPTILEELLVRGMSQKDALVMVIDMLMAGIDTTSNVLSFLLFLFLAKNPEKQELLRKEGLSVVGPRGSPITVKALNELHYLKACLKESFRLMPAFSGVGRVVVNDVVLSGYQVPKGAFVVIPNQYMCLKEKHFPKGQEYIPERWIKGNELESNANPYLMLPFGFGTRMCIGRRLAELEMWQLIAKFVQNFRIEYHQEDIGCECRMMNSPNKPLRFTFC